MQKKGRRANGAPALRFLKGASALALAVLPAALAALALAVARAFAGHALSALTLTVLALTALTLIVSSHCSLLAFAADAV